MLRVLEVGFFDFAVGGFFFLVDSFVELDGLMVEESVFIFVIFNPGEQPDFVHIVAHLLDGELDFVSELRKL